MSTMREHRSAADRAAAEDESMSPFERRARQLGAPRAAFSQFVGPDRFLPLPWAESEEGIEHQVPSQPAPALTVTKQNASTRRAEVDTAVRAQFKLTGVGLQNRVAVLTIKEFEARFPNNAVEELLLNLFFSRANTLITEILRKATLLPIFEPISDAGLRKAVTKLRDFIKARIKAGNFELQSLPGVYTQAPMAPKAVISASVPGFTTVNNDRGQRRVLVQVDSLVEVLVHEACHFYTSNAFRAFANARRDRFIRGMRLSEVLIEGYTEAFAREVMKANTATLGPQQEQAYQDYVEMVGYFTTTIGSADARAAFFTGNTAALRLLGRAVDEYAKMDASRPLLLVPRFVIENEAAEPEMLADDEWEASGDEEGPFELGEDATDAAYETDEEQEGPQPSQPVAEALGNSQWTQALELAIQEGVRDENDLTSLLFNHRHPELAGRALDPAKTRGDKALADEWLRTLKTEVRPVIQRVAEDADRQVAGHYVAERDPQFTGKVGKQFKELVEQAAADVDINPGFLAAVLLAEWDRRADYLGSAKLASFTTGTDDFWAARAQLRANVPAFVRVRFDPKDNTTNTNENGRVVTTVHFKTGRDAALATAVYLKWAEIKLRTAAAKNGGDFDALPAETRFALVRIAMAAGHGGITPDGEMLWFKSVLNKDKKWVTVSAKSTDKGARRVGVAAWLERVLKGEDILIRVPEARTFPDTARKTSRNATILAAQSLHLSDWVFGVPLTTAPGPNAPTTPRAPNMPQPSPETFEDGAWGYEDDRELDDYDPASEAFGEEVGVADELWSEEDAMDEVDEERELDPALVALAERIISREAPLAEDERQRVWTGCFSAADVARVRTAYVDNSAAADADGGARCSCIVMLNVALGQLLSLRTKQQRARGTSTRTVEMGDLTTETIEKAMGQLVTRGYALRPTLLNFFDAKNQTAGTRKPVRLKTSVQATVLAKADVEGCWFAFGLSIMDGYHSVLLLVDRTSSNAKIYWLDQFATGIDDDVTTTLDQRITDKTQGWWQGVMDSKKKGYDTTIRLWPLRKLRRTTT